MKLYYKIYKKTTVGQSLIIPGAGLFTLEDIKENELVNEYKGELVEKDELERRSIINMAFERNYGFELTDDFDIDEEVKKEKVDIFAVNNGVIEELKFQIKHILKIHRVIQEIDPTNCKDIETIKNELIDVIKNEE